MRLKIRHAVYKFFYLLGFYPPRRVIKPKQFHKDLIRSSDSKKEEELKKLSMYIAEMNGHSYYNKLLKTLIHSWDLKLNEQKFLKTAARGGSSLSSFRKVICEKHVLFEKVYFLSFLDLKRVEWFQDNIFNLIQDEIHVPKIKKIYRGKIIAATYYEFLELVNFTTEDQKTEANVNLIKNLYEASTENSKYLTSISAPDYILNYKVHHLFKDCCDLAKSRLTRKNINYKTLITLADLSKRIITHGDIYETNVFTPNILIDWDSFGLYPIGFDVAFMYNRFIWKNKKVLIFSKWLNDNYKTIINEQDWKEFEKNVYFFLYVFCAPYFEKGKQIELENFLIKYLENIEI